MLRPPSIRIEATILSNTTVVGIEQSDYPEQTAI